MEMKLFNTMGRSVQSFIPIEKNKVGMYVCGLTVYNFAHIGNLRTYIFVDILYRTLLAAGYDVNMVMNITDVGHLASDADEGEDKMVKSAIEKKMTIHEIADFYTKAFFADLEKLNIRKANILCKATDHIGDMIKLIQKLEQKGFTYTAGGNVYFDISKYPDYGKLALLNLNDLKAGSRIVVDASKKNPHDFVLWFTKSKFENQAMIWDSPWGKGYPGWHIECSAMSMKYLGEHFDIHTGGIDHIPVHHTNEIAQSEAATGSKWVNYWLHGEFLVTPAGKMSKSSGSFKTLTNLIEQGYEPMDYRYFCLSGHYRSQLQFSAEGLDSARNSRKSLVQKILELKKDAGDYQNAALSGKAVEYLESFRNNAANDLNMPRCLSDLWGMLKDSSIDVPSKFKAMSEMDKILGLSLEAVDLEIPLTDEQKALIEERGQARKNNDFARSDQIRDILLTQGIVLKDTKEGIKWQRK